MAVIDACPPEGLIIAADTVVAIDGVVFGKPANHDEAFSMLERLSGRTHEVVTGVCLANEATKESFSETTLVTFRALAQEEIEAYIATGEPFDKAGAYGIQGKGGSLVDYIDGDFDNVVGLPVARLTQHLRIFGITP